MNEKHQLVEGFSFQYFRIFPMQAIHCISKSTSLLNDGKNFRINELSTEFFFQEK
jgi:hypothetical protein